jgi:hypothetical protein
LIEWIREKLLEPDAKTWKGRRVLVFTEYTDTKRYLEQQLRAALAGTRGAEEALTTFHGGMNDARREEIKRAFNADPAKHPLRILIATDAAREGVNLQNHCADLFHFDVPWNPGRMEQRNGRIDRKLQRSPDVYCYYFFYSQRPEDAVLRALVRKTATIERELGSLSPVIDRRLQRLLARGIARRDTDQLATAIEAEAADAEDRATVDEELEAAREQRQDLEKQLDQLRTLLESSRKTLGLDEGAFRETLSSGLELLGAEPLGGVAGSLRFRFPALDKRAGADPTWAETLDTLRAPRPRDQKLWEWRRESPPRPVVFEDPGTLDGEVVHLHLEHRVVQRILGRFRAQGFVHDDLSRACVGQTRDAVPRVILLGRLSLYGEGAARLHDEVLAVAARWTDTASGPLRPLAEKGEAESRSETLLHQALLETKTGSVPEPVQKRLLATLPRDMSDLLPHLEERARRIAEKAVEKLDARGSREARDMKALLESQRDRIRKTLEAHERPQLRLDFDEEEKRQLEADRRHQTSRLASLEAELVSEPDRIRAVYDVKATRIEPVGIVYLWPVSG